MPIRKLKHTLKKKEEKIYFKRRKDNAVIHITGSIMSTSLATLHCFGDLLEN